MHTLKRNFQRQGWLHFLRSVLSYVLIVSLLWQNCLWARGNFQILEEDLEIPQSRLYGGEKIGIVEPAAVKEGVIHNVFEDFQLVEGGGVVFQSPVDSKAIYNRVYDADPVFLSGAVQVDRPLPMVFANTGGVFLDNPEFRNVTNLTLVAGPMAQTNKGMAYSVDQSAIEIENTTIDEGGDLRSLTLAGRQVCVEKSVLSPLENITITAGRFIKGLWDSSKALISLVTEEDLDSVPQKSIEFTESTILRSKNIFLRSLEDGASIHAMGLLQSTEEDIVIQAIGDVYINKIFANRNLIIDTTGNVYFKGKGSVGGLVRIKSKNMNVEGELSAVGKLFIDSSEHLHIKGSLSAQGGANLFLNTLNNNGTFSVFGEGLQGTISKLNNEGKLDFSGVHATIDNLKNHKSGVMRTKGSVVLQGNLYRNDGTVFTCGVYQATYNDNYTDNGKFYSPILFLIKSGMIKYLSDHRSYVKDGIVNASQGLNVSEGALFQSDCDSDRSFLQFNSQGNLTFDGKRQQFASSQFPLQDFFRIFVESSSRSYEDFSNDLSLLPLDPWKQTKRSLKSGVVLQAGRDLTVQGTISPDSGSVSLIAGGKFHTENARVKAGYFQGNEAAIKAKVAFVKDTTFTSLCGQVSLLVQEHADLINSHLLGQDAVRVSARTVDAKNSTLTSTASSSTLYGKERVTADGLMMGAKTKSVVEGRIVDIANSQLAGVDGVRLFGHDRLILSFSSLVGEYHQLFGNDVTATSITTTGDTDLQGGDSLKIDGLAAKGKVQTLAPHIELKDVSATALNAQGEHIKKSGALRTTDDVVLKALTLEQLDTTEAGGNLEIVATESYTDTPETVNKAAKRLLLAAEKTRDFLGRQQAAEEAVIRLLDMNLLALLNQTDAPTIEAHLSEGDVCFLNDAVIQQNLKLWARSFENRKKLTTRGNFIAHMQASILNQGSMHIQGRGHLAAKGNVSTSGIIEGGEMVVEGQNVSVERKVTRVAIPGGYRDVLGDDAGIISRSGDLTVNATDALLAKGAKFEARLNLNLRAAGLYLGAQQTSSDESFASKRSSYHRHTLTNHETRVSAGGNVTSETSGNTVFQGLDVTAGGAIVAKAGGTLSNLTVHDVDKEESKRKTTSGVLRTKKIETQERLLDTVVRNNFTAGANISFASEGDNTQQAPRLESGGKVTIVSSHGKVYLKSDTSVDFYSKAKQGKSVVWQSQQSKGHKHETVLMPEILARQGTAVEAAKGVEVDVKGQSLEASLKALEDNPGTSWLKNLRTSSNINWHLIEEEHKSWNHKAQGLTAAASAVIALAIGVATGGVGAELAGLASGTFGGTVASATFTSLVTQASLSLINNQGDLSKTFKDLGSKEQIRTFATSVISAGALHGVSERLGLPVKPKGFEQHLKVNVARSGVSAGLSLAQGEDPKKVLEQTLRGIAAGTFGGVFANKIGEAYNPQDGSSPRINPVMHKFLHAIAGAGMGSVLSKDPLSGAFAGALGGVASELAAEMLPGGLELRTRANLGLLAGALTALLTDQDVNVAIPTATNAVHNNFEGYPDPEEEAKRIKELEKALEGIGEGLEIAGKVIRNILEPGHERTDAYLIMSYEDFRAIRLSETDQRKLASPKGMEDFERVTKAEHKYWQEKPMGLAIAGLITGIGGLRPAFQPAKTNVAEIDLSKKSRSESVSQKNTWSTSLEFKGNKVYQRNDLIDISLRDGKGRTNLERMRSGNAPIGPDGESINLHHLLQTQQGPIAEMTQTFHQVYSRTIHINPSSIPSGINRVTFDKWRSDYWMSRARDITEKRE